VAEINVPKLMNSLLADLQSEAWAHGVKLVADISTELVVEGDDLALHGCLTQILGTIMRAVRPGSSISLVTALEPPARAGEPPALRVQIAAPAALTADRQLEEEVRATEGFWRRTGGSCEVSTGDKTWSLTVTLPGARLLTAASPLTAVVVDDDVDTQDFLRAVLEPRGYRVISVSDGFDALLVIERYQPIVVLTDILMPNMNGIDLVGRIKSAKPQLPVIVFSGYRDALVNNIAGLPDRILPKPMTRDQVLDALAAVVPKR
jgi:CheY-like chemotaxis protein